MKPTELLTTQSNANQPDKGDSSNQPKKIWERYQLENTPFWIIGNREQGYNVIMGQYRLTPEPFGFGIFDEPTIKHVAKEWLTNNAWDVTLSMILATYTDLKTKKTN